MTVPHGTLLDPSRQGVMLHDAVAVLDGDVVAADTGTDCIEIEDPATRQVIASTGDASGDLVDAAVQSAHRAQRNEWLPTEPARRARLLLACAAAIRTEAESLANIESVDTGKPISQARKDVETAARYFEYYGGVADKLEGSTIPSGGHRFAYTVREPFGVVAHITPWNSPLSQMARGVAPSLAAANTVVVKPSEVTPLSTVALAQLLVDAGLPPGACNVVLGRGPSTGQHLVRHPDIGHVTFTGSVETGRMVMMATAERIVECSLELGGKSPTIVLPDADLAAASRAGAQATVRNSGQSCFATTRMLVHENIYDEFLERCTAHMADLRLGHGLNDPDLGPLASREQLAKVQQHVADARDQGARLVHGGAPPEWVENDARLHRGHFFLPTLLADVDNGMRIAQDEVFGPVQVVIPFRDEAEAVRLANDSRYGLAAGLFTRDVSSVHRIVPQLEAGQVQVNEYPIGGVETPFGGYKQSGIGREKGMAAIEHYSQLKTVIVAIDPGPTPAQPNVEDV